eukprot:TRINITY_DN21407_c0_g1_i1.p1 TRINITY_DN21407_c0_g1~~TRINITY_DN21407_c0_g1_i1.p1  ORF type:complete len:860 (-),score=204.54 TRINITY_DN21407_c0_g1_i1:56-2635(-)
MWKLSQKAIPEWTSQKRGGHSRYQKRGTPLPVLSHQEKINYGTAKKAVAKKQPPPPKDVKQLDSLLRGMNSATLKQMQRNKSKGNTLPRFFHWEEAITAFTHEFMVSGSFGFKWTPDHFPTNTYMDVKNWLLEVDQQVTTSAAESFARGGLAGDLFDRDREIRYSDDAWDPEDDLDLKRELQTQEWNDQLNPAAVDMRGLYFTQEMLDSDRFQWLLENDTELSDGFKTQLLSTLGESIPVMLPSHRLTEGYTTIDMKDEHLIQRINNHLGVSNLANDLSEVNLLNPFDVETYNMSVDAAQTYIQDQNLDPIQEQFEMDRMIKQVGKAPPEYAYFDQRPVELEERLGTGPLHEDSSDLLQSPRIDEFSSEDLHYGSRWPEDKRKYRFPKGYDYWDGLDPRSLTLSDELEFERRENTVKPETPSLFNPNNEEKWHNEEWDDVVYNITKGKFHIYEQTLSRENRRIFLDSLYDQLKLDEESIDRVSAVYPARARSMIDARFALERMRHQQLADLWRDLQGANTWDNPSILWLLRQANPDNFQVMRRVCISWKHREARFRLYDAEQQKFYGIDVKIPDQWMERFMEVRWPLYNASGHSPLTQDDRWVNGLWHARNHISRGAPLDPGFFGLDDKDGSSHSNSFGLPAPDQSDIDVAQGLNRPRLHHEYELPDSLKTQTRHNKGAKRHDQVASLINKVISTDGTGIPIDLGAELAPVEDVSPGWKNFRMVNTDLKEGDQLSSIGIRRDPLAPLLRKHWRDTRPSEMEEPRPEDRDVILQEQQDRTEMNARIIFERAEAQAQAARRSFITRDEESDGEPVQSEDNEVLVEPNEDEDENEIDPRLAANDPYFNRRQYLKETGGADED